MSLISCCHEQEAWEQKRIKLVLIVYIITLNYLLDTSSYPEVVEYIQCPATSEVTCLCLSSNQKTPFARRAKVIYLLVRTRALENVRGDKERPNIAGVE